jgi:SpoVK/Ycf46/Vps4 family AAA+-type ATPase
MIGLDDIKNKLIDQLLYLTRGYNSIKCNTTPSSAPNTCIDCLLNISCCANSKEMLHTVITGPPGVGKTEFARILAKIYTCCGFIKNDKIIEITRKDLISGYLGRTAKKTSKLFKKAKSSVIFLDEAYSLGNTGNEDSYSKECIDIINKQLSENKDIIFIIAGYEKDINECFFRINSGLERRFPFKYNINGYNGEELFKIFEYKIKKDNWNIEKNDYEKIKKYIISNYKKYNNFAGDMEILLMKAKIKHSRNLNSKKYILTLDDIKE